jgi:uncharacterized membrane protein YbaN (DUF454 family)
MKLNESPADRIIRIVLGVILAALAITGVATGALAAVAWVVAAIAIVTGVVGFCPLYAIFRVSTKAAAR